MVIIKHGRLLQWSYDMEDKTGKCSACNRVIDKCDGCGDPIIGEDRIICFVYETSCGTTIKEDSMECSCVEVRKHFCCVGCLFKFFLDKDMAIDAIVEKIL